MDLSLPGAEGGQGRLANAPDGGRGYSARRNCVVRQPVVDTLRLSDTLRKAGMEREQAEGVARAFGKEFGEHVAVQGDLDTGFEGVRSEIGLMRSELEARIGGLRSEIALMRSELEARIEGLRSEMGLMRSELEARIEGVRSEIALVRSDLEGAIKALNSKFNFGFGLLAALLAAVIGILLGPTGRTATTMPTPPITINFPATAAFAPSAYTDSVAAKERETPSIAAEPDSSDP